MTTPTGYLGHKIVNAQGENFAAGDRFDVARNITGLPVGRTLTKAWLTVKKSVFDLDADATLQKVVTTTYVAGSGQITDNGATDLEGDVVFEVLPVDSAKLGAHTVYEYDIQVKLDNGDISTFEKGTIELEQGVTQATT